MQIDFHHTVTYVTARAAGFDHPGAEKIAYCAQYVDDAVQTGTIRFQNRALYARTCSAHKMADYRNFKALANHRVWLPFHFLPGNDGHGAGEKPHQHFTEKVVCRKESPVARDMIAACIRDRDKPFGLHRLGITMHVYADTWAHRGFAGINHDINDISRLKDESGTGLDPENMLHRFFGRLFDKTAGKLTGDILPLGHSAALSFPDLPYLNWSYKNHRGERQYRSNTDDFMAAANGLCRAMQRFRAGDADAQVPGLDEFYKTKIHSLFTTFTYEEGKDRHSAWLRAIEEGYFPFGARSLSYDPCGKHSWKHRALGTAKAAEAYPWHPDFLESNWKYFHDALLDHRFTLVHEILPRYGICAA
ncbi:MAG: hypothetical protein HUN04_10815 [Desulfobacter sp.]|nr:MAG: hypothetical protein HUN04_10815 [Desulfobacter sp.]